MTKRHKVLPRNEAPCYCGCPRKRHRSNYETGKGDTSYCSNCWEDKNMGDARYHAFKVDNLKYIVVLQNWNKTGVIQYPI